MTSLLVRAKTDWRIIAAITSKDLVEALRNKTTLTNVLMALAMVFFYRYMPVIEAKDEPLRVYAYDAGSASIVRELEDSPNVRFRQASTRDILIELTREAGLGEVFIEIPADFDGPLRDGGTPTVTAHRIHWISDKQFDEATLWLEDELTTLVGSPVAVEVDPELVYTAKRSTGPPFLASFGMIYVITMTGMIMIPHLMFEEKRTKTIEALLVSPAKPVHLVIGKALTGLFYCLLGFAVALVVNWDLVTHPWLIILMGVAGSLFSVSIGLLLGTLLDNRQQLMLAAWVILVPLLLPVFLSIMGDIMPPLVLAVIDWIPTAALSLGFRASFARVAGLVDFGRELAVVGGVAAILLCGEGLILRRADRTA